MLRRTVFPIACGWIAASIVALSGCTFGPRLVRPDALRDAPPVFLVAAPDGDAPTAPAAGTGCRTPMVDPRDGTRLVLDRSANGRGDYLVPEGRYGVPAGGWLRLECATGQPLGVVGR